jgi:hypothetical protein
VATYSEIREKIESLPSDEKSKFFSEYGGTVDSILKTMSANLNWESIICYRLGLPTEAERVAKATYSAASYAKAAFITSLVVGIPSLIIAVIALLKS